MKLRALEISEVNSYIKRVLTNDAILYNLKVKGEISNFKVHSSGNVYLSLKDEKIMLQLAKKVVKEELSVRELELLVKAENEQKTEKEKKPSKPKIKYFQEVELALHDHLGRKVSVEGTKKRGMLQIEFYGEEDLSELIKNLHLDT